MKLKKVLFASAAFAAVVALSGCPGASDPAQADRELTGVVSIYGIADVGEVLTANVARLGGDGGEVSFLWQRVRLGQAAFSDIGDWTDAGTHTVTDADRGHIIRVLARRAGYAGRVPSNQIGPVDIFLRGEVEVLGDLIVGLQLRAGSRLPGTGAVSYQWYRVADPDDEATFVAIAGATSSIHMVSHSDVGYFLRVAVSRSGFGGYVYGFTGYPVPAAAGPTVADQIGNRGAGPSVTLTLHHNERIDPQVLSIGDGVQTITLVAGAHGRTLVLAGAGAMFTVGDGVTLELMGVELRGMDGVGARNDSALAVVADGGVLRMGSDTLLADNENTATAAGARGGGVRVETGGSFVMEGGAITGNFSLWGGGVKVETGGSFTMKGGTIAGNNVTTNGGGVRVGADAEFVLMDGTIRDNTANVGGGVFNVGTVIMHGGRILENRAVGILGSPARGGGVAVWSDAVFDMLGGEIAGNFSPNLAGGVINAGTFTMHGGRIRANTAAQAGGVQTEGVFVMYEGAEISDNTANAAGGVMNAGVFTMYHGAIRDNRADQAGGMHNQGGFTMHDGAISGNRALIGGGVLNYGWIAEGTVLIRNIFRMLGGSIFGNIADQHAGGVFNFSAEFQMSGGVIYGLEADEGRANRSSLLLDGTAFLAGRETAGHPLPISRIGEFDGVVFDHANAMSLPDSGGVGFTLRVENGEALDPVFGLTVTGVPDGYVGYGLRLVLIVGNEGLPMQTVEVEANGTAYMLDFILPRQMRLAIRFVDMDDPASVIREYGPVELNIVDPGPASVSFGLWLP